MSKKDLLEWVKDRKQDLIKNPSFPTTLNREHTRGCQSMLATLEQLLIVKEKKEVLEWVKEQKITAYGSNPFEQGGMGILFEVKKILLDKKCKVCGGEGWVEVPCGKHTMPSGCLVCGGLGRY